MTENTDAAASLAALHDFLRAWAIENDATELLPKIEEQAQRTEQASDAVLAAEIVAGIQQLMVRAGEHEMAAYQRVLDAKVRAAERKVTAVESEIPGLAETVDKAASAEQIAHDDAQEARDYLHRCEDAVAHARERKVPAAQEAHALEQLRDAQVVAQRREAAYEAAMSVTHAARKALREDGHARVTAAKDALDDARLVASAPGPAPRSVWTLGLLGPWMALWGAPGPALNEDELSVVRDMVLAMASVCGADRTIANRERSRIEAEIRESRSRTIQTLSKRAPRIDAPAGHNVWPAGVPTGAAQG
jgi:hypothetical protein